MLGQICYNGIISRLLTECSSSRSSVAELLPESVLLSLSDVASEEESLQHLHMDVVVMDPVDEASFHQTVQEMAHVLGVTVGLVHKVLPNPTSLIQCT